MCAGLNFALCVDVVCVVSSVLFLSYFMCRLLVVFSLALFFVFLCLVYGSICWYVSFLFCLHSARE